MSHIDINDVVAHIKPEYIVTVDNSSEKKQEQSSKDDTNTSESSEPPTKKQKVSGTNKHRPKFKRLPKSEKLCRYVWGVLSGEDPEKRCTYPNCGFSHDTSAFLAAKPPDLGDTCHNFRTFGMCQYGVVCRFGSDHIKDGRNQVNDELWVKHQKNPPVANTLSKELMIQLRKRQYSFDKAKEAQKQAQSIVDKSRAEAEKNSNSGVNKARSDKPSAGTIDAKKTECLNGVQSANDAANSSEVIKEEGTSSVTKDRDSQMESNTKSETVEARVCEKVTDNMNENDAKKESSSLENTEKDAKKTTNQESLDNAENENIENDAESKKDLDSITENVTESSTNGGGTAADVEMVEAAEMKVEATNKGKEEKKIGPAADDDLVTLLSRERKKITWENKTYLAPLTTLGNLPFRRVCKNYGVDITCGEMAMATCLLQGAPSEWALVKRHESEDIFGVQICGSNPESMIKCTQLLEENVDFDFLDINMGCPIDMVYKQGGGSALMRRVGCLEQMVRGMTKVMSRPLTLKMRTAIHHNTRVAHNIISRAKIWDVNMITVHGRSREQRYLKLADWDYIDQCAQVANPIPLFGNGDVMSYEDYNSFKERSKVTGIMIGRGALIKPWVFKEIKEQRHWDISSSERFDMLKMYVNYGLEHWGSDTEGIEKTRRFLLEWLSFLHRYIPVGLLSSTQRLNQRPPTYQGRDELETLMASRASSDWVKISEMLLGPTPSDFQFLPKHKANGY